MRWPDLTKQNLRCCDIWDTDYNTDNWGTEFMTIFVIWQLIVKLDSIRNSCDVFNLIGRVTTLEKEREKLLIMTWNLVEKIMSKKYWPCQEERVPWWPSQQGVGSKEASRSAEFCIWIRLCICNKILYLQKDFVFAKRFCVWIRFCICNKILYLQQILCLQKDWLNFVFASEKSWCRPALLTIFVWSKAS